MDKCIPLNYYGLNNENCTYTITIVFWLCFYIFSNTEENETYIYWRCRRAAKRIKKEEIKLSNQSNNFISSVFLRFLQIDIS